jgi:hypothetical protein
LAYALQASHLIAATHHAGFVSRRCLPAYESCPDTHSQSLLLTAQTRTNSPTITSFIGVSSSLGRHGQTHWAGARSPLTSLTSSPAEKPDPFAAMAAEDDNKKRDYTVELGDRQPNGTFDAAPKPQQMASSSAPALSNSPPMSILAYCGSSILMTVTNKYVLNSSFNLNFFLLAVQVGSLIKTKRYNHGGMG